MFTSFVAIGRHPGEHQKNRGNFNEISFNERIFQIHKHEKIKILRLHNSDYKCN